MFLKPDVQETNTKIDDYLLTWLEAFLVDRKARGMAKGTISYYINKLKKFSNYCQ